MKILLLTAVAIALLSLLRRKSLTIDAALSAISVPRTPLEILPNPRQGEDMAPDVRLGNNDIDIFYNITILRERKVETIDVTVGPYSGGIIATFVNDEIVEWTRGGLNLHFPNLPPLTRVSAHKVLETVRERLAQLGWSKP